MHVLLIGSDIRKRGSRYTSGREELVRSIIAQGHQLTIINGLPYEICRPMLAELGAGYRQLEYNNLGNGLKQITFLKKLTAILKSIKADAIVVYGVQQIPSVCLAAKLAGVPKVFAVINGSGRLFQLKGAVGKGVKMVGLPLLRYSLGNCERVFFQNDDDLQMFKDIHLVGQIQARRLNGSGVNTGRFVQQPMPEEPIFLLVARLLWEKGIQEYLDAARLVKQAFPLARFQLIGAFDSRSGSVNEKDLQPYMNEETIEYLGVVSNIQDYYAAASVFVLPSYYREGIPRTILEAMATGRPIITTDSPGCRETVENGLNGFIIPPRNVEALADKMIWMIQHQEERMNMGNQSRYICENKFDVNEVNKIMLNGMELQSSKS